MIAVILLVIAPALDAHWNAVLACPRVSSGDIDGTGVVIGVKDGFAYLLTASHVATSEKPTVEFSSRENYPKPAWRSFDAVVVARWPDPDIALVRFPTRKRTVPTLALAPAWQRPKRFPADSWSIGAGTARAETILAREFVKREGKAGAFFWKTKAPSEAGRSGGPILDSRGRVIGIAVAARGQSGYYTHHDELLAALKREGHGWLIPAR